MRYEEGKGESNRNKGRELIEMERKSVCTRRGRNNFFDDVKSRRVILDQTNTDQAKGQGKPQTKQGENKQMAEIVTRNWLVLPRGDQRYAGTSLFL
jgi:hypothetical protein